MHKYKKRQLSQEDYFSLCNQGFHDVILESLNIQKQHRGEKISLELIFSDLNKCYVINYVGVEEFKCNLSNLKAYCEMGDYLEGNLNKTKEGLFADAT